MRLYDTFGNVVRDVSQFFRTAQKMVGSRTCTIHTMLQILSLFSFVKEPANSTVGNPDLWVGFLSSEKIGNLSCDLKQKKSRVVKNVNIYLEYFH